MIKASMPGTVPQPPSVAATHYILSAKHPRGLSCTQRAWIDPFKFYFSLRIQKMIVPFGLFRPYYLWQETFSLILIFSAVIVVDGGEWLITMNKRGDSSRC